MKKLFKRILDLFKQKCPACSAPMENTDEWKGSKIYSCKKCKIDWF